MKTIVILIGPSAVGKSFTSSSLVESFPQHFTRVKAYTTRQQRSSESRSSDRVFVSDIAFERMVQEGQLSVQQPFAGHRYGWRKVDLESADRHLVVGAPPSFLPQFLQYQKLLIVGMQASANYKDLLDARMKARGDSSEIRAARHLAIERDIHDLEKLLPIVTKRCKIFQIEDDQTVPNNVIPWIVETLNI